MQQLVIEAPPNRAQTTGLRVWAADSIQQSATQLGTNARGQYTLLAASFGEPAYPRAK